MTELAKCPNVSVKVGGLMMRLGALDYLNAPAPATIAANWPTPGGPYASPCLELFGADRCLVETNFPVDKMGIGYAGLLQRPEAASPPGASADEKKALFSGTAKRVYRLALD